MKKFLTVILFLILLFSCQTIKYHFDKESIFYLVEIDDLEGLKACDTSELSEVNKKGLTLLHVAMMYNRVEIAEYLISKGADIEALDNYARSPLLLGVYNNSFEAMKVLTSRGANIFSSDYDKNTPFKCAVKKRTYKHLLDRQNVRQKDVNGLLPINHANKLKNKKLIDYILSLMATEEVKKQEQKIDHSKKEPVDLNNPYATKEKVRRTVQHLLDGGKPFGEEFTEFEIATLKRNFSMRFNDGNTPLHYAAKKGHIGIVDFLISKNVNLDAKNISNSTPLHEAVRNGQIETALLLLNAKADPNARDANGNTALHLVMPEASRSQLFTELLKNGADVNAQDDYGDTPIHIAARIGMHDEIILKLVKAGADPNERNKKGQTPLMLAVERNNLKQAKTFIDLGANIHDQDNEGVSSFSRAVDLGLDAVKLMVNKKNIGIRDSLGRSPLHVATYKNANTEVINYLLKESSDINTRDKDGNSPLHVAVKNNYKEIGELLISKGGDIFITNKIGDSPLKLSYVLNEGREDWVVTSQTIHSTDATGNTPLHLAAEWDNPDMIKYLLDRGANINAKNDNGETPFFSSIKGDSPTCIDTLLNYPESNIDIASRDFLGNCVLHTAVQWSAYNAATKITSLTDGKTLVRARNLAGKTALHIAASQGNLCFIQMLLGYGVDVNETDELGQSPLVYAINGNKLDAVKYLLAENASPIQQDMYGRTPMHFSVENKNVECTVVLQKAGARAMTKDSNGVTPLTLAFKHDIYMIDAVLGQSQSVQDSDGQNPLHIAVIEDVSADKLKFLLVKDFYKDKRNKDGNTCLLFAVQLKRSNLIVPLLNAGTDPFISNNQGMSPLSLVLTDSTEYLETFSKSMKDTSDAMGDTILHYAARLASPETVKKLLTLGHNPNKQNLEGQLPVDIAHRWEKQNVVSVFEDFAKDGFEKEVPNIKEKSDIENTDFGM